VTSVQLTTADSHVLTADLALPIGGDDIHGAVVLCHPHPQYGGNRFNTVVDALFDALPIAGYAALRFDFRQEFGGGVDERLDVVAALDHLDSIEQLDGAPRSVVGYSFGAAVALNTTDRRISAIGAIAPPLAMTDAHDPGVPVLVLTPRHDQFSPPGTTEPIVRRWPASQFDVIEGADHFLAGHTAGVAERVVAWLDSVR
jgi:uncharacterized protein